MKPALIALALAGCVQAPAVAPGPDVERPVAPGFLLLAYFDTGADEPPTGGVIRACATAASGLCLGEAGQSLHPLEVEGDGWRYVDSGGNRIVLNADGRGRMSYPAGGGVGLIWTTEAWHD